MKERPRNGYGFNNATKELIRQRAGNACEYPSCTRPNTGKINHLVGCFEGKLKGIDKKYISGTENGYMWCIPHEIIHDQREQIEIKGLLLDKK